VPPPPQGARAAAEPRAVVEATVTTEEEKQEDEGGPAGRKETTAATPRTAKEAASPSGKPPRLSLSELRGRLELTLRSAEDQLNHEMLSLDRRFQVAGWMDGARDRCPAKEAEEASPEERELPSNSADVEVTS